MSCGSPREVLDGRGQPTRRPWLRGRDIPGCDTCPLAAANGSPHYVSPCRGHSLRSHMKSWLDVVKSDVGARAASVPVLSFVLLWRYGGQTETPARADGCRAADIARVGEPAQDRAGAGPAGAHRTAVRRGQEQYRGGRRAGDHPGDRREVA